METLRRRERFQRIMVLVTVLAFLALVASVALILTTSRGEQEASRNGMALHTAELLLGAATSARAHLGETVHLLAFDHSLDQQELDATVEETLAAARLELDQVETHTADLVALSDEAVAGLEAAVTSFAAAGARAADELAARRAEEADAILAEEVVPGYERLAALVVEERSERASLLAAAAGTAGWVVRVARFLTAFLIPVVAVLVVRDVSRRRQERTKLEAELRAEQEISRAKDEFIANVSHELRTPLTSIYGFARVLESEDLPESVREVVELIVIESEELSRMVDDLLTAARVGAGALRLVTEDVDLQAELHTVLSTVDRVGEPVRVQCEPVRVRADRVRLRQVLRNLLSNARRHGGPAITVAARREGPWIEINVTDDGPGVPEDIERRLFERFVHEGRTPILTGSVGLGLSIVRTIVDEMGGTIGYERQNGETRFAVRLPAAEPADATLEAKERTPKPPRLLRAVAGAPRPGSQEGYLP